MSACTAPCGEIKKAGREQPVGIDDDLEKDVVDVQGQKEREGEDVDELAHQRQLLRGLRVEDIGGGKAHLVADDGAAEAHGA